MNNEINIYQILKYFDSKSRDYLNMGLILNMPSFCEYAARIAEQEDYPLLFAEVIAKKENRCTEYLKIMSLWTHGIPQSNIIGFTLADLAYDNLEVTNFLKECGMEKRSGYQDSEIDAFKLALKQTVRGKNSFCDSLKTQQKKYQKVHP